MLVVMGISAILVAFSTVNILGLQQRTQLSSKLDTLVTDFRAQQVRAMIGEADDSGNIVARGIHFDSNRYVLYRGSVYNPSDPYNFTVNLEGERFVNINFPNANLVFSPGSGEPVNFSPGEDSVTLQQESGGIQKTVTVNKYGTIISVD